MNIVSSNPKEQEGLNIVSSSEGTTGPKAAERERAEAELLTGDPEVSPGDARFRAMNQQQENLEGWVENSLSTGIPTEEISETVLDSSIKASQFASEPELSYEYATGVANPYVTSAGARFNSNMHSALTLMSEAFGEEEEEAYWKLGDGFLDFVDEAARSMTLGIGEAFDEKTEKLSRAILFAANTKSAEEFSAYFQNLIAEAKEEGVLRGDNVYALYRLQNALMAQGYDPNRRVDKVFATVDLIDWMLLGAGSFSAAAGKALRTTTTIGRKTANEGVEAAVEHADSALKGDRIDAEVLSDTGPKDLSVHEQAVSGPSQAYDRIRVENEMVREADNIMEAATKGAATREELDLGRESIEASISRRLDELDFRTSYHVSSNTNFMDFDAPRYVVTVTRPDGLPFKPLSDGGVPQSVQAMADEIDGVVRMIDPTDPSKGFKIEKTENIKFTDILSASDISELTSRSYSARLARHQEKFGTFPGAITSTLSHVLALPLDFIYNPFATAKTRSLLRNTTAIDLADRNTSAIKHNVVDKRLKGLTKLKARELFAIDKIATEIRDGVFAKDRFWLTEEQFARSYEELMGEKASKSVIEGYKTFVDLWDFVAYNKARGTLSRYIETGYKGITFQGNLRSPGRKVNNIGDIPQDAKIFDDANGGNLITKADLKDGDIVFAIVKPMNINEEHIGYVVRPSSVGELRVPDVMGYNAGGSRTNKMAKYFVGALRGDFPRIILSATSRKQVNTAIRELSTLQKALREGNLTDDLVNNNSQWNGGKYSTEAEFRAWLDKDWPDFADVELGMKARDEQFVFPKDHPHGRLFNGVSARDYVEMDMRRQDRVLDHFGGEKTKNVGPMEALQSELNSSLKEYAFRHHNLQAAKGLVGAIENHFGEAPFARTKAHKGDVVTRMLEADIPINDPEGIGLRMNEQRNIIKRRMGVKGDFRKVWEGLATTVQETVFDGYEMLPDYITKRADKFANVRSVVDVNLEGIVGKVLGWNHFLVFAMSPFQMVLQGLHATTIMARSNSGIRGVSLAFNMRGILNSYQPGVERHIHAARLAQGMGYTPEQMDDMIDAAWKWGANVIDGENLENGMGHVFNMPSVRGEDPGALAEAWHSTRKVGSVVKSIAMMPYNGGERFSQMSAFFTAADEFIKANPKGRLTDPDVFHQLSTRANTLAGDMRRTNRSLVQTGPGAVPMQWMTYMVNMTGQVMVGRDLSVAERTRLFAALAPAFGLTGLGFGSSADKLLAEFGVEPGTDLHTFLKNGLPDGLANALGVPTGVAPRLSVLDGWLDLGRRFREDTIFEILGGPTASIGANVRETTVRLLDAIRYGGGFIPTNELFGVLRNAAGINSVAVAVGMLRHQEMTNRKGEPTMQGLEFDLMDALVKATGATTLKESEFYSLTELTYRSNAQLRKEIKTQESTFENIAMRMNTAFDRGDIEELESLQEELWMFTMRLDTELLGKGYNQSQMDQIRKSVLTPNNPQFIKLLENLTRLGYRDLARGISNINSNLEE